MDSEFFQYFLMFFRSVFGKLLEKFVTKLRTSGRFIETGFANEKVFLELWKSESYREMVMTVGWRCLPKFQFVVSVAQVMF